MYCTKNIFIGGGKIKINKIISAIIVFALLIISNPMVGAYSEGMEDTREFENTKIQEIRDIYDSGRYTDWYYKPSSYSELVGWYQSLETNYSDYIEIINANQLYNTGTVTGGYDLYYVRITNESLGLHKPEVLFLGSPHGDETAGTISLYWFTDWLMRKACTDEPCVEYSKDWLRWLLDNREIYIEISHNPYGFDHVQRYDGNDWDINREADFNGPGSPTGGIWASVNGQTLYHFMNNHSIRVGCDFHGGTRLLIYAWSAAHGSISGTSPVSGYTYDGAPPDFYFYDTSALRLGSFMGNPSGEGYFDEYNTGTVNEMIWYSVYGDILSWAYASDVIKNPVEDPYVEDEIFGNYPGSGALWVTPEMSYTKNPPESDFGNDTVPGFGWEVRRYVLHQTDLAQPYVKWKEDSVENNETVMTNENVTFKWEVNGCMVVDETNIQWGTDPDPINNPDYQSTIIDDHAGGYVGGTAWDNANDGIKAGTTYVENITFDSSGEYYFVAKAKVDQIYNETLAPYEYGQNHSYLRLIKERVNSSYYEVINGTDGLEIIEGQLWWYSPIIKVNVQASTITQDIQIYGGWNMLTIPVENNYTASTLGQEIQDCSVVSKWNAQAGYFQSFLVGISPPAADFAIENGVGYFVYADTSSVFSVSGDGISSVSVDLYTGWNMLGWCQEASTTADDIGSYIVGCNVVSKWNSEYQYFNSYLVGISPPASNFDVNCGNGIFVYVDQPSTWNGQV